MPDAEAYISPYTPRRRVWQCGCYTEDYSAWLRGDNSVLVLCERHKVDDLQLGVRAPY